MQVRAVTNSYMLPQGARCTASPRVITAVVCAATPSELSSTAATTQPPASLIARNAGTASSGMAPSAGPPAVGPPAAGPRAPGAAGAPRSSAGSGAWETVVSEAAAPAVTGPTGATGTAPTVARAVAWSRA